MKDWQGHVWECTYLAGGQQQDICFRHVGVALGEARGMPLRVRKLREPRPCREVAVVPLCHMQPPNESPQHTQFHPYNTQERLNKYVSK